MTPDNNNDENINAELSTLKNQVFILLVALIVVSGTLTVGLYRQVSIAGKDMQQCQQILASDGNQALINNIVGQLVNYGEKHPDYLPVLKKYGITPSGTAPAAPKK
jgi:hypothetical protein